MNVPHAADSMRFVDCPGARIAWACDVQASGDALIARARDVFLKVDADGYVGCSAAIRDMDLRDALALIRAPTLVITGSLDPSTPSALGQEIAARAARW